MKKRNKAAIVGMLDDLISQGIKPISEKLESDHAENNIPINLYKNETNTNTNLNNIIKISPNECALWAFKDRPLSELGDIDNLAMDIQQNGQLQPGIARFINISTDASIKYELIVGERRWRACKLINMPFSIIIKNLSNAEAAIYQSSENDQRKNLSDYAKGMSYIKLIDAGILSSKDLEKKLQKSQSHIRDLLSFSRLSSELIASIGDMTKISARTSYEIVRWQEKGEQYKEILLELAPKLAAGDIGANKLQKLITYYLNSDTHVKTAHEIKSSDGRHIFTWRKDTNGQKSIGFPKEIRSLLNFDLLQQTIIDHILLQIKNNTEKTQNENQL